MIGSRRAPDEQRRQRLGQVEAVERRDALAARVQDGAHRLDERVASLGVAERGEPAGDLGEVGAGPQAQHPDQAADRLAGAEHAGVHQPRHHPLRAGQRRRRAATGAPRARGRRWRPGRGARSAPGTGRRTASRSRRRASGRRSSRGRGRGRRSCRAPRSRRRRASSRRAASPTRRGRAGRAPAPCARWRGDRSPGSHCSERPVIPWISTTSGPSPASRKATR